MVKDYSKCEITCEVVGQLREELKHARRGRSPSYGVKGGKHQRATTIAGLRKRTECLEALLLEWTEIIQQVPQLSSDTEEALTSLVDRCRYALGPRGKTNRDIPRRKGGGCGGESAK